MSICIRIGIGIDIVPLLNGNGGQPPQTNSLVTADGDRLVTADNDVLVYA